jgi:hypothetical protein
MVGDRTGSCKRGSLAGTASGGIRRGTLRSGESARRGAGRRLGYAIVVASLAVLSGLAGAAPEEAGRTTGAAGTDAAALVSSAGDSLAQQVDTLRLEVAELRAALVATSQGQEAPPWAARMQEQLDRRLERMAEMQERLAARIEMPAPRLDEPIVLFTVAGCTLLLGFVVGRGMQRRSNRRDLRLRL